MVMCQSDKTTVDECEREKKYIDRHKRQHVTIKSDQQNDFLLVIFVSLTRLSVAP